MTHAHSRGLDSFVQSCAQALPARRGMKMEGWEPMVALLVYEGLKSMLPELKQWVKLGYQSLQLKRQDLEKELQAWAKSRELDMAQAEQASRVIAEKMDDRILAQAVENLKPE